MGLGGLCVLQWCGNVQGAVARADWLLYVVYMQAMGRGS